MIRAFMCLLLLVGAAQAHETTRSYLTLTRDAGAVTANLRVAFRDIEVAVWLDDNLDGNITWGETTARLPAVQAYVLASLDLATGATCTLIPTGQGVFSNGGIDYLELDMAGTCPDATAPLVATSRLFADIDPDHRLFLSALIGGAATTTVLSTHTPQAQLDGNTGGRLGAFVTYLRTGVEHLFGGADHLLFLFVLMLPAVSSTASPRKAALGVLTAITGFTLAHALTLTAATFQVLHPR
jgi:HupE / UreJ protein